MTRKIAALALLFVLAGCFAGNSVQHSQQTLNKTASSYYTMLMWKHYKRASAFVDEERRDNFEEFVLKYEDDLNITSYEVQEIVYKPEENASVVRVLINFYKYPSVSEKSVVIEDTWVLKEKTWYVSSDFDGGVFE